MGQEDKRLRQRVRNSYFVATVSIAMVLFLLGSVTYLITGALDATDRLKESVTIYVMLADGLPGQQTDALRQAIENEAVVREVKYVAKEDAAAQFIAETGDDFTTFIDYNPLPNSFEVSLGAQSAEKEIVERFVEKIGAMPGVSEVLYQKNVVEQIGANLGKLNYVLAFFGLAMLVISLILLRNTVRMTIIAKRQIINTMKLVGAGRGFIMRQFVGSAAMNGFYAGIIACLMLAALVFGIQEGLPGIERAHMSVGQKLGLLADNELLLRISLGMIVGGMVISLVFTAFAVSKAVKQITNKSYL